jgi:hypothetical protein
VNAGRILVDIESLGEPALCYGIDPWAAGVAATLLDALEGTGVGLTAVRSSRTEQLREPM